MSLFAELKRRNVFRVAAAYVALSWLLIQVVETVFPAFGSGDAAVRLLVVVLAIGLIPVLVLSWVFELTSEGFKRDAQVDHESTFSRATGRKLDRIIMVVLSIGIVYFALDKFVLDPVRDAKREATVAQQARSKALVESYGDKSIAVLPFEDLSPEGDQEYFSDGISEELLNLLTKIPELRVISRSSAFAFKGQNINIPVVASKLNVAHVLEGSVRKAGNQVRITAQLIDARSDTHLWSETYDRNLDDIFATQDEIATEVVEQLKLTLLKGTPRVRVTDPEAYALFLRAKHIRLLGTPEDYQRALDLYKEALEIDPGYPPAWEGLAEMYVYQANYGLRPVAEAYRLAREAINKSLAIDPDFGVGVAGLGWIAILYDHDLMAGARHIERAMQLDPTNLEIISAAAYLAEFMGDMDRAIAFQEYAVSRDPMGPLGHFDLAGAYLSAGRPDDAIESINIGLTLRPDHIAAHYMLGKAFLMKGDLPAALAAMQAEPFEIYRLVGLALAYYELGQEAESDRYLNQVINKYAKDGAHNIAGIYAWRGQANLAFDWLEKALENNDTGLASLVTSYSFVNLHEDPRWQPFLEKIGRSNEQLAVIEFNVTPPE